MSDSETAREALVNAVQGPKRVKGDAGEVEQQSLADLIAAEKHLAAVDAASKAHRGLRFTKLVPPGAV